MKKILAIALALVFALAAVSSLALYDRGTVNVNRIYLEKVQISQASAVVAAAVPNATYVADLASTYVADQIIYGALVLNYNTERTVDNAFKINLKSDNVTFPSYYYPLTTPATKATVHYTDNNGVLQLVDTSAAEANIYWSAVNNNVATVNFVATLGSYLHSKHFATLTKDSTGVHTSSTLYVGFMGAVKAPGTATEGKVTAYEIVAPTQFTGSVANVGTLFGRVQNNGVNGYANYVDVYKDGKFAWRVYDLFYVDQTNPGVQTNGHEFLIQEVVSTSPNVFKNYAIGFANNGANDKFLKVTLRRNMPTAGYDVNSAAGIAMNNTPVTGNIDVSYASYVTGVKYSEGNPWGASIDALFAEFVDFYGFNFAYTSALRDTDFSTLAGYNKETDATFKYFGTVIPDDDDPIIIPETGDASASLLIVLGASALLAAAALFFVMKKARD